MVTKTYPLMKISAEQAFVYNGLARFHRREAFRQRPDWKLSWMPLAEGEGARPPGIRLDVALADQWMEVLLRSTSELPGNGNLMGKNWRDLSWPIQAAFLTQWCEPLLMEVESVSGERMRIETGAGTDASDNASEAKVACAFALAMAPDAKVWGTLQAGLSGWKTLFRIMDTVLEPSRDFSIDILPVPLSLCLGFTTLGFRECLLLDPGDVILVEPVAASTELLPLCGQLRVGDEGIALAGFVREGHHIKVKEIKMHEKAVEEIRELTPERASPVSWEELGITLVYEVGRQLLPLKQLRSIGPGSVLEFPDVAEGMETVTLRVQGQRIGTGRLVKVNDRLGVQITEMNPSHNPSGATPV